MQDECRCAFPAPDDEHPSHAARHSRSDPHPAVMVGVQVRVAVNVMRARLTVIGFNIAIVSFQIGQLNVSTGGIRVPGMDRPVHVGANVALYMALAISLIALLTFIISCALDEVGICNHWTLVACDLLMYLGLAHTVAGYFAPLATSIEFVAANLPAQAAGISILHAAAIISGGTGWFLAIYAGPTISLLRSPFPPRTNIALGIAYIIVLLAFS